MDAGKLRTKITVQNCTVEDDFYDEPIWADLFVGWCKWVDLNSVELLTNDTTQGNCFAVVTMRSAKVDGTCRIKRNDEIWDVMGDPKHLENGRFIELRVRRKVAG